MGPALPRLVRDEPLKPLKSHQNPGRGHCISDFPENSDFNLLSQTLSTSHKDEFDKIHWCVIVDDVPHARAFWLNLILFEKIETRFATATEAIERHERRLRVRILAVRRTAGIKAKATASEEFADGEMALSISGR